MFTIDNFISDEVVQKIGWVLLHLIWQAAAVAFVLAFALRVLRRFSANTRYIAACLALLITVVFPFITMQFIEVTPPPVVVEAASVVEQVTSPIEHAIEMPPLRQTNVVAIQQEQDVIIHQINWKQEVIGFLETRLPFIVTFWLFGVFALSIWHLGGYAQLQKLRRKMVKQVDSALNDNLKILAQKLGVSGAVQLLESALVQIPTVVGWLKPVILLPASALTGLTSEQLEAILAHELAHIKRFDYLVNILQTFVEILGFYHPAVWWISHKIRTERENCCDDLAVAVCGDRINYAKALTSMEEIRSRNDLAIAATGGNLFSRIRRLLGKDSSEKNALSWIPAVIIITLLISLAISTTLAFSTKANLQISEPNNIGKTIAEKPEVSKLLAALEDKKFLNIRSGIIPLVEEIDDREPIAFLAKQLKANSRERRCNAALLLELLGDNRGVPAIIKELNDTSYRSTTERRSDGTEYQQGQVIQDHYYAALLLGILADKRATPALIEATKDEKIDYQAAISLGQIGDKSAVTALQDMLKRRSENAMSHLFAAYGLAMLGDKEGFKLVINTLNNQQENWTIRRHAIEALGKLGNKEAVPDLIASLKDEHPNIKVSAAKALGEIGDVSALPALKLALEDKTKPEFNTPTTVSEAAAEAITQIQNRSEDTTAAQNETEKSVAQVKDEIPWGQLVEGVQVRLQADKTTWKAGEVTKLKADVRNNGTRELLIYRTDQLCELSIDGQLYRQKEVHAKSSPFGPGKQYDGIEITLDGRWYRDGADETLKLSPGKHIIQVTFTLNDSRNGVIEPVPTLFIAKSNPVEIEILPAEEKTEVQIEMTYLEVAENFLEKTNFKEAGIDVNSNGVTMAMLNDSQESLFLKAVKADVKSRTYNIQSLTVMDKEIAKPVIEKIPDVSSCEIIPMVMSKQNISLTIVLRIGEMTGGGPSVSNEDESIKVWKLQFASTEYVPNGKTWVVNVGEIKPDVNQSGPPQEKKRIIVLVKPTIVPPEETKEIKPDETGFGSMTTKKFIAVPRTVSGQSINSQQEENEQEMNINIRTWEGGYSTSSLVGTRDSNISDAEVIETTKILIKLIMKNVEPDSWFQNNPEGNGTIYPYPIERPFSLKITNTTQAHKYVQKLFDLLRALSNEGFNPINDNFNFSQYLYEKNQQNNSSQKEIEQLKSSLIMIETQIVQVNKSFLAQVGLDANSLKNSGTWSKYRVKDFNDSNIFIIDLFSPSPLRKAFLSLNIIKRRSRILIAEHEPSTLEILDKKVYSQIGTESEEKQSTMFESGSLEGYFSGDAIVKMTSEITEHNDISLDMKLNIKEIVYPATELKINGVIIQKGRTLKEKEDTSKEKLAAITVFEKSLNALIPDGHSLLIIGNKISKGIERESKTPILGDLPIVNRLFINRSYIKDEYTILILIKTTILSPEEAEKMVSFPTDPFPKLNMDKQPSPKSGQ